jgi:hypothetical protein
MSTGQGVQIAFTYIGNAVGAAYGYPGLGSFAGAVVGGVAGRAIDAQHLVENAQGPRLADNKVQVAAYGVPIPRVYGALSIAGNLIWTSDLIETPHKESSTQDDGKGGGSSQTVNATTYSYSVNCAIGLCAGPIDGFGKIWANGKLIYNAKDGTDAATALASQSRADGIRIYLGSETQLADPLIEAAEGAGNVPAFRGLAYVVLEDFQLAEFGNQMPLFEFEVMETASEELPGMLATITTTHLAKTIEYHEGTYSVATDFSVSGVASSFTLTTYDMEGDALSTQSFSGTGSSSAIVPIGNWRGLLLDQWGTTAGQWYNVETHESMAAGWLSGISSDPFVLYRGSNYAFLLHRVSATAQIRLSKLPVRETFEEGVATTVSSFTTVPASYPEKTIDLWTGTNDARLFFDGTWVWVARTSGTLYKYTQDLVLVDQWTYTPGSAHGYIYVFDERFAIGPSAGNVDARLYQLNGDGTATELVNTSWDSGEIDVPYPPTPGAMIGRTKIASVYPLLTGDAALLSDIVEAECELGGLDGTDLDVTDLSDDVRGYVVRRDQLGANLQPLMTAFFFDAVESDGQIKFVKRGGASAVTFSADDLAAREGGEEPPDPISHTHAQELALPLEVAVVFLNANANYEPGAQYARRQVTSAKGQVTLELPIVLTDDEALNICNAILFDLHAAREAFAWPTSREFAKYEPGDVVTLPYPTGDTSDVRITKRDDGANGVIRWEGQFTDAGVYTQDGSTQAPPTQEDTISLPGPTLFNVLDLPLLRDVDDTYGFYGAALGYLDGWRGAQAYVSRDNGASYDAAAAGLYLVESTMGYAETALGTTSVLEQFDEASTVDVHLAEGTLSSVTRAQVLDGYNLALLGDELIQFRTATQLAAQRYRLTGFLRGRLGTDWAAASHAVNERFVMLDRSAMHFMPSSAADVGVARLVKAVTVGNRLAGALPQAFTYEGVNLTPLAPVHFAGGRDGTGNLNMAWTRRTRLNATWRDYVDAPIGEASESYELDVMNGSTVVRTLTATTNSKQYTAAQQTTDFGSPQASIAVNLYQLSDRIGRGYAASATL